MSFFRFFFVIYYVFVEGINLIFRGSGYDYISDVSFINGIFF